MRKGKTKINSGKHIGLRPFVHKGGGKGKILKPMKVYGRKSR